MDAEIDQDRARRGRLTARAAELYEEWFVPALFGQWPDRVADLAGVGAGDHVLDVGCGTGVLARACATRVGEGGSVSGLDPQEGMLAVARRAAPDLGWWQGVAEAIPWPEASFDRVLSQFALMFVTDPDRAVSEIRRVTRPGGRVVLTTWADVAESPGYAAMVDLVRTEVGDGAARALLAPFTIGTPEALLDLVRPAFPDAQVHRLEGTATFPSVGAWLDTDVRAWTLADLLSEDDLARLHRAAPAALAAYVGDDGRVAFPAPALAVVGER